MGGAPPVDLGRSWYRVRAIMATMTMQKYPTNPIERRKQAVRTHSRNAAIYVGAGVIGGIALGLLMESMSIVILGFIIAVVGGGYEWSRVKKIVNYKDPQ